MYYGTTEGLGPGFGFSRMFLFGHSETGNISNVYALKLYSEEKKHDASSCRVQKKRRESAS